MEINQKANPSGKSGSLVFFSAVLLLLQIYWKGPSKIQNPIMLQIVIKPIHTRTHEYLLLGTILSLPIGAPNRLIYSRSTSNIQ